MNEALFISSVILYFGCSLLFYYLLGRTGLFLWTGLAVLLANIEVIKLVEIFGMEMTLGNVLFASTLLTSDLLSEVYGKKDAKLSVYIGFISSLLFVAASQLWLSFTPTGNDFADPAMRVVFGMSPRIVLSSMLTYFIVQQIDIYFYHKIWNYTAQRHGKRPMLWLRNNLSRFLSQALNCIAFNLLAFAGVFPATTLVQIIIVNYFVFIVIAMLDTPFLYIGRSIRSGVLMKYIDGKADD